MRGPAGAMVTVAVLAAACASSGDPQPAAPTVSAAPAPVATSSATPTNPPVASVAPATSTVASRPDLPALAVSPNGRFTYSMSYPTIYDNPRRGTLLVDAGDGAVPALRDGRDVFDDIREMTFGPDGLVAWTSFDDSKGPLVFIGRIDDSGRIVDTHRVGGRNAEVVETSGFDRDGVLTATTYQGEPFVLDTRSDPFFVMSAEPMPTIDTADPLIAELESEGFWARDDPGFWYRGDTLGGEPACGASTLYKDDADGFARVLHEAIELDTVVAIDAADDYPTGGIDSVGSARPVVISTECPGSYDGRRVYWGLESIDYGDNGPRFEQPLWVEQAFDTTVAEVVRVTALIDGLDDGCCLQLVGLRVEVELLDGTTTVLTADS